MEEEYYMDDCDGCGDITQVKCYPVPTNGFVREQTNAITLALWCDECAKENKDLILSDDEVRALGRASRIWAAEWALTKKSDGKNN
jgi:hypothetical protein